MIVGLLLGVAAGFLLLFGEYLSAGIRRKGARR